MIETRRQSRATLKTREAITVEQRLPKTQLRREEGRGFTPALTHTAFFLPRSNKFAPLTSRGSILGTVFGRLRAADAMTQRKLTEYEIDTRGSGHEFTSKEIEDDISRVAGIIGETPTRKSYKRLGSYSQTAITNKFENWTAALKAAGHDIGDRNSRIYSNEDILGELRRVSEIVERPPTRSDYEKHAEISRGLVTHRFGNWLDALEEAGLEVDRGSRGEIPLQNLIEEMLVVAEKVDRPPYGRDMDEHGEYSAGPYKRRFGSWAEALRICGLPPRFRGRVAGQYEVESLDFYGRNWKQQRVKALNRDRYRCQSCGRGVGELRDENTTGLHVHHIIPIREFDEPEQANFPENLITLCRSCHRKTEGLTPNVDADVVAGGEADE